MKSETAGHWLNEEPFEQHKFFPVARVCKFLRKSKNIVFCSIEFRFMDISDILLGFFFNR